MSREDRFNDLNIDQRARATAAEIAAGILRGPGGFFGGPKIDSFEVAYLADYIITGDIPDDDDDDEDDPDPDPAEAITVPDDASSLDIPAVTG